MSKSRKQKTGVKKKSRPSQRSRKTDEKVPVIPLLEGSTTENEMPENAVATLEAKPADELEMEDYADVSEERASIISIVQGLEGQVETAFKLKEVLEVDLEATQQKLSEELAARAQLEARVESLEAQASLVDQVREDISFAEEERTKLANLFAESQQQLEAVTAERDSLAEKFAVAESHVKELESDKTALEAQVMNLKDKVVDMDHLHEEVEGLQEKLTGAGDRTDDLRVQLEQQQAVNRELMKANGRLESEKKTLNVNYEAAQNELVAFKKALRDIRSEVTLTSGRVRQRYFKPKSTE